MLNVIDVVDHGAPLSLLDDTGDTSAALRGAVSLVGENPNVSVSGLSEVGHAENPVPRNP